MTDLLTALSRAVGGAPGVALLAAFGWGVLSVLLSPCHLASIPLIVGFVDGQGRIRTSRAFLISLLFSVGILITVAAIGAITAAAGRMLGDLGRRTDYVLSVVLVIVGLMLLDVIPAPWAAPGRLGMRRRGGAAAFVLGLAFGVALGPCTFAFMAPMLAAAFGVAAAGFVLGALLLAAYAVGHCSVIVLAGTFTGVVQRYLNWNERSRGAVVVRRICGALVIVGGVYLALR
jgi:cytochrome c-type biogenesis protein